MSFYNFNCYTIFLFVFMFLRIYRLIYEVCFCVILPSAFLSIIVNKEYEYNMNSYVLV
jgi:hypothetical protein